MEINTEKFKAVAETAKSRTNNARWQAAIDKAVVGILSGEIIVTELVGGALVTTENASYMANGSCGCKSYQFGKPCRHRAAARLIELYTAIA